MSVTCTACGKTNRTNAMFCGGCAGRLPAFAPTGPSALEAMKTWRSPTTAARPAGIPAALPAETPAFWFRLGSIGLAMVTVFIVWYLYVMRELAPIPGRSATAQAQAPTPAPTPVFERRPALPPPAETLAATPAPPPAAAAIAREDAVDPLPLPAPVATARSSGAAQTVASFYRALSVADGTRAVASVVPAKRGNGAYDAASMSKFYGSFKEPLVVRSIRQIDHNVVEAKYTYRVSRTRCEGTAVVETESVRDQTLIRRIRANC